MKSNTPDGSPSPAPGPDGAEAPAVLLTPGLSGSTLLHRALLDAVARFPALADAAVPTDGKQFKAGFAETLVRFEAHRADSADRVTMAHALSESLESALHFGTPHVSVPLGEHLRAAQVTRPKLSRHPGGGTAGWVPRLPFRGTTFVGRNIIGGLGILRAERLATEAALDGMTWALGRLDGTGRLDLRGERFALMGAGAELAPTEALVAAGAEVLWLDKRAPDELLRKMRDLGGTLVTAEGCGDILAAPERVKAAIEAFAAGRPVHVGLFAYAPGRGRELRLAHAMHAIVKALGPEVVRSVSLFVSPTTPGEVPAEEKAEHQRRREQAAVWKKALERVGLLKAPGAVTVGATTISRSIVGLQGATYQAAQYLAKMMAAEALAVEGLHGRPVTVSANVAGITATRSLEHPLFAAAFLGAPRFGIEIFEPPATRVLSTLLLVHDLLNPEAPGAAGRAGSTSPAERGRALAGQSIHGGVRALPWVFDETIRVAAVLGLGKKPGLVMGLLPGGKPKKKGRTATAKASSS